MKIMILVEGRTEKAFRKCLENFLKTRLQDKMPKLQFHSEDGRIPKEEKLRKVVENHLHRYDAVIALTDVYTGTNDFTDAQDAKTKMQQWVGKQPNFYPHVALHDFEAWLIPYWDEIQKLAGHNKKNQEITLNK